MKLKLKLLFTLVAVTCAISTPTWGHHSFPANYRVNEEMSVEGVILSFKYRNPHSVVHLNVVNEDGETERWLIEWAASVTLGRMGIERATFKPGDRVIITGSPGRNPEDRRLRMLKIKRLSDGYVWPGEGQDADYQ